MGERAANGWSPACRRRSRSRCWATTIYGRTTRIVERALARAGATRAGQRAACACRRRTTTSRWSGIDDPWTGTPDADAAFAGTADAGVRIAVVHAPEGYPFVRDRGAALMLCGHTHGGQVATPRGPIVVPGPLGPRWPAGLYDVDGLSLYVSRGLGVVELSAAPVRAARRRVVHDHVKSRAAAA